ncbi:hypothetical protein IAD21_06031 [Abditibacteriota bacterium]|nr:hypothetical protein IAD21_06031 [Abditibacteriota bacterium]
MAYPIQLTLGTGSKVSVNYQSEDVSVSVTYQLERGEDDLLAIARDKADEVVAAQQVLWERVRDDGKNADASPQKGETPQTKVPAGEMAKGQVPIKEEVSSPLSLAPLSGGQLGAIEALLVQAGWSQSQLEEHLLDQFGKADLSELSAADAAELLVELQRNERQRIQSQSQSRKQGNATRNGRQ